jgi:hypothetical protein
LSSLIFFNDRQNIADFDSNIVGELESQDLITNGEVPKVSFCGLLVRSSKSFIFLPRSINLNALSESEKIFAASELMRAVGMYGKLSKTAVNQTDSKDDLEGGSQLDIVMALFKSYQERGLYTRRKQSKTLNSGKPDWRATVVSSVAYPDRSGRPVYLDVLSTKRRYYSDCEVARIQAFVLRAIDEKFSWIMSGRVGRVAPELDDVMLPRGECQYMLSILKRELPVLYSDNDVNLVKLLINYLEDISGNIDSNMTIGLKKFHFAWEFMLSKVLTDCWVGINRVLPAPAYKNANGNFENAFRSGMKTDTVLWRELGGAVIVDAKYYAATTVVNAPGWGDIVKQFFYEKALLATGRVTEVKNVFIFPGTVNSYSSIHLRSKNGGEFFDDKFPPIHCYYACPLEVVHHFINNKKMREFTDVLFGSGDLDQSPL